MPWPGGSKPEELIALLAEKGAVVCEGSGRGK